MIESVGLDGKFSYHDIRVGKIHGCPTRPKIRVGLLQYGSGAYEDRMGMGRFSGTG